ncbi:hypothetical protein S7711_02651 [Stachybotrys chartarum IBT 7711]|uniref:Adenosine deaminase domain-containing protein n=1 Tax=Stachybotrys chartarum (strain CBS 109288 / IBT 7711) TaxID=1280523 RepID=A0A084B932_STACB|nr:hypothetical protein S7711_02651 [Stachybotrys chartarum IBT 7711]
MAGIPVSPDFTKKLPKVELHAHLTGSISVATLHNVWLDRKSKDPAFSLEDPTIALPAEKVSYDVFTFFPLFDNYIYALCSNIESIRYVTNQVLRDFEADGVRYLELRTTPRESIPNNVTREGYVSTVLDCINAFDREKMSTYLILSVDRRNTPAQAMETVDLAIRFKDRGVVGVDLCGNPLKGDVSLFREAFHKAKAAGLKITLHFAEVPESSTQEELLTLLSYEPHRIGHVINVPDNIKEVIAKKGKNIGLELCLSCNVHAKLIPGSFGDHHFGYWKNTECSISICVCHLCYFMLGQRLMRIVKTDDVGIFQSPISNEYLLIAQHFNLGRDDLIQLSQGAVDSIFSGHAEKDRMLRLLSEFRSEIDL